MNTKQHNLKPGQRPFEASGVLGAWPRLCRPATGFGNTLGQIAAYLLSMQGIPQAGSTAVDFERAGFHTDFVGLSELA